MYDVIREQIRILVCHVDTAQEEAEEGWMNAAGDAFKDFVEMSLDSIKFNKH